MTQQSKQSSTTSCLKDKLADTEKKANEAEFHKQTAATLKDLIDKNDKELNTYRDALPGLIVTWREQDKKIKEMKRHLESCYPEWECYLKQSVCEEVMCKNWRLRQSYESKLGAPELRLEYANADKDKATKQLEAWKTISTWIAKRLSDNKSLYDRICALDNCKSPLLQLYLFYFILWPQHRQLCKSPRQLPKKESYPEYAYCSGKCKPPEKSCTCLVGYPWIIDPENFDCQLSRVWQAWSDAGIREAKARSAYEQIAKDKEEYQKTSTPEAVEKAAEEALARFDKLEKKPCPKEKIHVNRLRTTARIPAKSIPVSWMKSRTMIAALKKKILVVRMHQAFVKNPNPVTNQSRRQTLARSRSLNQIPAKSRNQSPNLKIRNLVTIHTNRRKRVLNMSLTTIRNKLRLIKAKVLPEGG